MIISLSPAPGHVQLAPDKKYISLPSGLPTAETRFVETIELVNQAGDFLVNQSGAFLTVDLVQTATVAVVQLGGS